MNQEQLPDMPYEELVNLTLFQAKIIPYFVADDERNKAELLKRLNDGEKAIEEVKRLTALRFESGKQVAEAIKQAEDLACCGNCDQDDIKCDFAIKKISSSGYCDKWQSDKLKREDRKI